jgi:hypothetical protein
MVELSQAEFRTLFARRARRLVMLAVLAVTLAAGAVAALSLPWYLAQVPAQQVSTSRGVAPVWVEGASATITGHQIADAALITPPKGIPMAYNIADVAGVPRAGVLVVVASVLLALAAALRLVFPSVVSLAVVSVAWQDLGHMRAVMETGVAGSFNTALVAVSLFTASLAMVAFLAVATATQCALLNRLERRALTADGVDPARGDVVSDIVELAVSRLSLRHLLRREEQPAPSEVSAR